MRPRRGDHRRRLRTRPTLSSGHAAAVPCRGLGERCYGEELDRLDAIGRRHEQDNLWRAGWADPQPQAEPNRRPEDQGLSKLVRELLFACRRDESFARRLATAWAASGAGLRSCEASDPVSVTAIVAAFFQRWLSAQPGSSGDQPWEARLAPLRRHALGRELLAEQPLRGWLARFANQRSALLDSTDSTGRADEWRGSEGAQPNTRYRSFDEFFHRRYPAAARPIAGGDGVVIAPTDGALQLLSRSNAGPRVQAALNRTKARLAETLGDPIMTARFTPSSCLRLRLGPTTPRWWHAPVAGRVIAIRQTPGGGGRSERLALVFETRGGPTPRYVALLATCDAIVGRVRATITPGQLVSAGQPVGRFVYGGSDVHLLLDSAFRLDPPRSICRMGERVAHQRLGRERTRYL